MNDILYIKFDDYIKVNTHKVSLSDVVKLECSNRNIVNKLKETKIYNFNHSTSNRIVYSSLKIIEIIHSVCSNICIIPIGPEDFLLEYEPSSQPSKIFTFFQVSFVSLILFFGAAFSIMAFNNDISINNLFSLIFESISGTKSDNHTFLELGYSLGIPIGILVFYNHFGAKKISKDPTPIEIEMRLYENDISTTLIKGVKRKECNIDVDD